MIQMTGSVLQRTTVAVALVLASPLAAAPPVDPVEAAVNRGVKFLLTAQKESGCFQDVRGRFLVRKNNYPLTSMALMAMAAVGHQPSDESREGLAMRRGLNFLLEPDNRRGAFEYYGSDGSRMYGHGITTLCLTEFLGMGVSKAQDGLIRQRCEKAVELILRAQRVPKGSRYQGGWRYTPTSRDSDLSITVWQLMALRSAKNAGINVPKSAIDRAVEYVKRSYKSQRDGRGRPLDGRSGFGYVPGAPATYSTTSAGLLSLQVCGEYTAPEVLGAAQYLENFPVTESEDWFYYGTYYYAQGMQKRGGGQAKKARETVERLLLRLQSKSDGSWSGRRVERMQGRVYSTALALLSLSVRYHFLPIYQH